MKLFYRALGDADLTLEEVKEIAGREMASPLI